uniref:glutamic acid-rich protein-like n=1 Tax=Fragaria vesca subsp. vesca TaxID=101020 RepID=UPI0005C7EDAF|nr:PREDICTED: glutamic acid-rich protein-like [Fragaria vesca subsp. vesca]
MGIAAPVPFGRSSTQPPPWTGDSPSSAAVREFSPPKPMAAMMVSSLELPPPAAIAGESWLVVKLSSRAAIPPKSSPSRGLELKKLQALVAALAPNSQDERALESNEDDQDPEGGANKGGKNNKDLKDKEADKVAEEDDDKEADRDLEGTGKVDEAAEKMEETKDKEEETAEKDASAEGKSEAAENIAQLPIQNSEELDLQALEQVERELKKNLKNMADEDKEKEEATEKDAITHKKEMSEPQISTKNSEDLYVEQLERVEKELKKKKRADDETKATRITTKEDGGGRSNEDDQDPEGEANKGGKNNKDLKDKEADKVAEEDDDKEADRDPEGTGKVDEAAEKMEETKDKEEETAEKDASAEDEEESDIGIELTEEDSGRTTSSLGMYSYVARIKNKQRRPTKRDDIYWWGEVKNTREKKAKEIAEERKKNLKQKRKNKIGEGDELTEYGDVIHTISDDEMEPMPI